LRFGERPRGDVQKEKIWGGTTTISPREETLERIVIVQGDQNKKGKTFVGLPKR